MNQYQPVIDYVLGSKITVFEKLTLNFTLRLEYLTLNQPKITQRLGNQPQISSCF